LQCTQKVALRYVKNPFKLHELYEDPLIDFSKEKENKPALAKSRLANGLIDAALVLTYVTSSLNL